MRLSPLFDTRFSCVVRAWVALCVLTGAALPALAAEKSAGPRSPLDPTRDPRLSQRLSLQAEGIPVSRVLGLLTERTGVPLRAEGTAGDERLVAFAPGATLAVVMERIADLYRLTWVPSGRGATSGYQLLKPPAFTREETGLRQRALRQVVEKLSESIRAVAGPGGNPAWANSLPLALPLLFSHSDELLREGSVYLPLNTVPAGRRDPLLARLQPELDKQHALNQEFLRKVREKMIADGQSDFAQHTFAGEEGPAPPARGCTLIAEIEFGDQLRGRVSLKTGIGVEYYWLEAASDDLQGPAMELYADRHSRVPSKPGIVEPPDASAPDDLFNKAVEVPSTPRLRNGDWIAMLRRLSTASGLSIYADCYTNYLEGIDRHPRSAFTVAGQVIPAQVLDAACYPPGNPGVKPLTTGGFWWRRGTSALLRSRRWLWEEAAVLPASLADHLTQSLRATHRLTPDDLVQLAALNGLQVRNAGFLNGHQDTWRLAIQLPARLSPGARQQVLQGGISWPKLSAPDQVALARWLAPEQWGQYQAEVMVNLSDLPSQGGAVATIDFRTGAGATPDASLVHLPLPGVSADEKLTPRGLTVELIPKMSRQQ